MKKESNWKRRKLASETIEFPLKVDIRNKKEETEGSL